MCVCGAGVAGLTPAVPYLRAAVNGLPSIHYDVTQGVVAVQLHRVELPQFDGVGVPYGGHS